MHSSYIVSIKGKHPKSGGARRKITWWHQASESSAWCQQVISRLTPPDEWVFSFYTILLLLLWRRISFGSAFLLRDPPCSTTFSTWYTLKNGITCLLMPGWCKKPGHQQLWYWLPSWRNILVLEPEEYYIWKFSLVILLCDFIHIYYLSSVYIMNSFIFYLIPIILLFIYYCSVYGSCLDTLRQRQNAQHFADGIFTWIFLNGNVWISIKISLKFVPKGLYNYFPALVKIMAWRQPGDKPLSEPLMVRSSTHICITRP